MAKNNVDLKEVNYCAIGESVIQIANRSAKNQRQRDRRHRNLPAHLQQKSEDRHRRNH